MTCSVILCTFKTCNDVKICFFKVIDAQYLISSPNWSSLLENLPLMGLIVLSLSCVISSASLFLCKSRGLPGTLQSLWTPISSQFRIKFGSGDERLVMSGSRESCFWNLTCEKSWSRWAAFAPVAISTFHVSGAGLEWAKRTLNSLSNKLTAGPLRTVISCRCRWASVHVRLQRATAAC